VPLAFRASQQLQLAVPEPNDHLSAYLNDEERVIQALLDPSQLTPLAPGRYRYTVTRLRVFQLQIQPVVELVAQRSPGRLELAARDCQLEGLGPVEDFELTLSAWLEATGGALDGEAILAVRVSQPPLLKLVPPRALEATGGSLLAGILLGIKSRVAQQLVGDYQRWARDLAKRP
jgi:hypothetical protein